MVSYNTKTNYYGYDKLINGSFLLLYILLIDIIGPIK